MVRQVPAAGERISRSDGVRRSTGGGRRASGLPTARLRLDVRGAARDRRGRRRHRRERLAADGHHREPDSPDRPLRSPDRARHLAHGRDPADVAWAGGRRVLRLRGPQRRGVRVHLRALHRAVDLHDLPDHRGDVRRHGGLGLLHGHGPVAARRGSVHGARRADPGHDREHLRRQRRALLGHDLRGCGDLRGTDRLRHAEAEAVGRTGRRRGPHGDPRRAGAVPGLHQPLPVPASHLRPGATVEGIDYNDVVIVAAVAAAAPLMFDLLPLPKVPPMVTEIVAGMVIGPHVLDIAHVDGAVQVLSQIGLVFLFFLAGLEIAFDADSTRHLRLVAFAFGVSLALSVVVAHLFEAVDLVEAPLLVSIVLAATAFGIVVAVLSDAEETSSRFGQLVIAAASVADFATVILLSLFFSGKGSGIEATLVLLGMFAGLVAIVGLTIWRARAWKQLTAAIARMQQTTAQMGVRIAFVLLIALVFLADEFGLEVVLGAFLAGAMVSLLDREGAVESTGLKQKLEGVGFGVFIPVFFVASGMRLNLSELFESFSSVALVPAVIGALLVVRALPALVYRSELGARAAIAAGLLQATSLPFIVAATQIGVELHKISDATAAGLVAGGVLSVLLFPAVALALLKQERWASA